MSQEEQDKDSAEQPQHPPRSSAEWVSFSIAASILTALIGLVLYTWLGKPNSPPVLSLQPNSEIREDVGQFYVPFAVKNSGTETAESVQIIAELRVNDKVEETGEQMIDFLSGGETEEGAFIFSRNPRDGELIMRVASYKIP